MASPVGTEAGVPDTDYLTFVFDNVNAAHQDTNVYIDAENPTRALSVRQTKTLVRRLIAGLKATGLERGDCVLVVLANSFLYSSIFFGIIGAGGVYIGVNPTSQVLELDHIVQLANPKFIITSPEGWPKVQQACHGREFPLTSVYVLDTKSFLLRGPDDLPPTPPLSSDESVNAFEPKQWSSFDDLTTHGESDWVRFYGEQTARNTPAAMFATSGTSGLPKAAISSHYALISQHLSMEHESQYEIKRLISLPFFHCFAALFAHVWPIRNAQPLYILPRFQPDQYLNAIQRYQITDTVMAPPIVHTLNRMSSDLGQRLNTIRWIGVGGAPISKECMQQFESFLPQHATLSQVWGMTEIGVATLVQYPERHCWGSIGRPLPGYEMQLLDAFGGIIMNDSEPGSLRVRYSGMMTGYKDQTPHPVDGWYDTGDIMTRVAGMYFVVGRSKELIKVNGWQVAPAELEAVLLTHPHIADVGVVGALDEDGVTEVPRAYVVPSNSEDGRCSTLSTTEIYNFARDRLASYKALKGGIFFVQNIPRTASGKIQRFKLAQMDQYRCSITEVLVHNNGNPENGTDTSESTKQKVRKVKELKARVNDQVQEHEEGPFAGEEAATSYATTIAEQTERTAKRRRSNRHTAAPRYQIPDKQLHSSSHLLPTASESTLKALSPSSTSTTRRPDRVRRHSKSKGRRTSLIKKIKALDASRLELPSGVKR